MNRISLLFIVCVLLLLVVACGPAGPIEVTVVVTVPPTATVMPTDVPIPTATAIPTNVPGQGDPDCFGGTFPAGFFWVTGNRCLTGEIHSRSLWEYYDIDDARMEYWRGDHVYPYQAVTAEELDGFYGLRLENSPAWVFAVVSNYRGVLSTDLQFDLQEVNGRFGVQYSQDFVARTCYNFKAYVRMNVTAGYRPTDLDFRLEVHGSNDERSTLFNVQGIPDPVNEYEFTWVGYTLDTDLSGAVLMYLEIRDPDLAGNMYIYSAGTLRAPDSNCWNADGSVKDGVYRF